MLFRSVREDAYRCAPRELAIADTSLDFTLGELAEGDMNRAKSHYREAQEFFRKTLAMATGDACRPKPPPLPKINDRDGDGVPDEIDKCPDDPGPKEWDGCPDSDGDGIPDHKDKCPHDPTEHVGITYDPVALQITMNALARSGPANPAYQPAC